MIVRLLSEGQYVIDDSLVDQLNEIDRRVEAAVTTGDQTALTTALTDLHQAVRHGGQPVPDDEIVESQLVLPEADATLAQVKDLFDEQPDGLIPG